MRIFYLVVLLAMLPRLAISGDASPVVDSVTEGASITLTNFMSGQKETITNPQAMTADQSKNYVPQIDSAMKLHEAYLAQGYSPLEAVLYTYYDLMGLKFNPAPLNKNEADK